MKHATMKFSYRKNVVNFNKEKETLKTLFYLYVYMFILTDVILKQLYCYRVDMCSPVNMPTFFSRSEIIINLAIYYLLT